MKKSDVIEFFDRCAPTWDAEMIKSDEIIGKILDHAEVQPGQDILDVACGTGVMFPYYLERGVGSVTGVDISPEMARIAEEKYAEEPKVRVLCGDIEEIDLGQKYDVIVVYNAFPHFPNPQRLIAILSSLLKEGGRMTIAHGASREAIDGHHGGAASKVSNGLMSADSLQRLFRPYFEVEVVVSNRRMYQVSGVKRGQEDHAQNSAAAEGSPLSQPAVSVDMLLALMKYTVEHNGSHVQELAELAEKLYGAGKTGEYYQLMDVVSEFGRVNDRLAALQAELAEETRNDNGE